MTTYLAQWPGGAIYLSSSEQMDQYLGRGASIYQEEDGVQTLIATPEDGYLVERPVFPQKTTFSFQQGGMNHDG